MEVIFGILVSLDWVFISWFDELFIDNLFIVDQCLDILLVSGIIVVDFNFNLIVIYWCGFEIEVLIIEGVCFNIW